MSGRLDTFAKQSKSSGVLLDGPYGGVHGSLRDYDRVLLLAGGSGAFVLSNGNPQLLKWICETRCQLYGAALVGFNPRIQHEE